MVIEQGKAVFERGFFKPARIIVLFVLFSVGCASQTPTVKPKLPSRNPAVAYDLFEKGRQLSVEGNHEEAIKIYEQALQVDPKLAIAAFEQAVSLFYVGQDFSKMKPLLAFAVEAFPNNPRARLYYGRVLANLNRIQLAQQQLKKSFELRPDFVEPRMELAEVYERNGQYPAAQEQLEAVLKKHPAKLQARIRLAELHARQTKYEEAAREIERAAVQAGRSAALYRKAAKWYSSAGKSIEAQRMETTADEIDPPRKQRDLRPLRKAR